jgi:hypothetical protein
MAVANEMVACTISGLAMLGSTWSSVMASGPLPAARAAVTKSRCQILKPELRVMRAKTGMLKMPMATMLNIKPGP